VPIYIAAAGPKAAEQVGRIGDGFICTSGKGIELVATFRSRFLRALSRSG